MNKDKAAAMLPVITAFAEGKQIQHRSRPENKWEDCTDLGFSYGVDCYRIKPDPPRVLLRIEDETGRMYQTSWEYERKTMEGIVKAWNNTASTTATVYRLVEYVEKVDA